MVTDPLPRITDETIEEVAAEAFGHPRSVERRLLKLPVKGRVAARVDAALDRRGLLRRDPSPPNTSR